MIARIWTASYADEKRQQLEAFAENISLPYLSTQPGNKGVIYLAQPGRWITITLWDSVQDYTNMEFDPAYKKISNDISETGAITDVKSVELFEVLALKTPVT